MEDPAIASSIGVFTIYAMTVASGYVYLINEYDITDSLPVRATIPGILILVGGLFVILYG
jgi:hypothetical protein